MFPGGSGTNYLKFGVYRSPMPFDAEVRFAHLRVGTTRESVQ